ncbi:hypothetical protein [Marinomonas sp. 2405UD68-3]|uniref:secretion/conjugation apparatus DotM-related subunit n=1 Tax=Marinomonas sp. 2405UD68-3 TaxID=3391835 RepID=UPI0039C9CA5A
MSYQSEENQTSIIWGTILIFVALFLIYFGANTYLKYPAYRFMVATHGLISYVPMLASYLPEQYTLDILREFNNARYVVPEARAIRHINVSMPFYLPLLIIFLFFMIKRYARQTLPYTYRYKISTINNLVKIKEKEFPEIAAGYLYGSEMVSNPDLQRFGTFSQEYGPIRYLIKIGAVSLDSKTLFFKDFPHKNGLQVVDDIYALEQYAGRLDININILHNELISSLGKKINDINDLSDIQIALSKAFLMFSMGIGNKTKSQNYLRDLSRKCIFKKIETAKEVKEFKIDRKKELADLKKLLIKIDNKTIFNSKYQKEFVLSCYAHAKSTGADISPPEFNWVKAFERETYLLLHTFSGDPSTIKNNSYIEVIAPLSRWLDLYKISVFDKSNNYTTQRGDFSNVVWEHLLLKQIQALSSTSSFSDSAIVKRVNDIRTSSSKKNKQFDFSFVLGNDKIVKKLLRGKLSIAMDQTLRFNNMADYILTSFITKLDEVYVGKIETENAQNILKGLQWVEDINYELYCKMAYVCIIKQTNDITLKQVINSKNDHDLKRSMTSKISDELSSIIIQKNGDDIVINKEMGVFDSNGISFSELQLHIYSFIEFQNRNSYSSKEYKNLAKMSFSSIDQATKSILYYMTNFENWLKPEYHISLEEFLGGQKVD